MKWNSVAAVVAVAAMSVALALPAEAAKRKRQTVYYDASGRQVSIGRAPTRFTVRPRSYLNPGTETKQYEEHYTDYALPPGGGQSYRDRHNYDLTWTRNPLPDPWDIPGWPKF